MPRQFSGYLCSEPALDRPVVFARRVACLTVSRDKNAHSSLFQSLEHPISASGRECVVDSSNDNDSVEQKSEFSSQEGRSHPRIKAKLGGRYMLADQREFECAVIDVAVGGIALSGPENGAISESVIAYIDQLGRVQGEIVRHLEEGFALKLTVAPRAAEKLAVRLSQLKADDRSQIASERRREPRIAADDKISRFRLPLGEGGDCEVRDLSRSGADIKIKNRPPVGALVQLGQLLGKIVRHTEHGVAVEFEDSPDSVSLTYRFQEVVGADGSAE